MKGGVLMEGTFADFSNVINGITDASSFIFSLFKDFIDMIASNSVLLYLVEFSILAGTIGLVIGLIRRFGLKGRRK